MPRFGGLGAGSFARLGGGGSAIANDPLAPSAPTLDLIAASDTGSSSTDNITTDTTPDLDVIFGTIPLENDILKIYDSGVEIVSHTITALEAGGGTLSLGLAALSAGVHSFTAKHDSGGHISRSSGTLSVTVDTTAPTISTSSTANCAENATLAISLAADETVTWSITGGADQARFEISSTTLRWASNGTKNFESPDDADTNNTYVVQVTATDTAGNATNKTITVTVTDVNEAPTVANTISDQNATVGAAFSFQFAANTFSDVDAGDTLTYSATRTGGAALPSWLTFTAGTRTFSGTPAIGDVETIAVTVTATDSGALSVATAFNITVAVASARQFIAGRIFIDAESVGTRQWIASGTYIVEN